MISTPLILKKPRWRWWQFSMMVVMLFLLVTLGCWQLRRAEEKRHLLAAYQNQTVQLDLSKIAEAPTQHPFAPVQIHGQWLMDQSFLLDNQYSQHQVGYHVFTPVQLAPGEKWVLVDRGFIRKDQIETALGEHRGQQTAAIRGRVYAPDKQVLLLGNIINNPGQKPIIFERVDFAVVEKQLGHPLYPFVIWLDPSDVNGFVREWTPAIMPPERHQAYAAQWFGLAFALVCIMVVA